VSFLFWHMKGVNKKNSALLFIDVINMCAHEKGEIPEWGITFKKIRKMVPRLLKFIGDYKKAGGQVIYINCVPWKKKFLADNINELYKNPACMYYSRDSSDFSEQFYGVMPDKEDKIFTKNSYDAFTNPQLKAYLKKKGIRYLLVVGIFGDGCVDSTIHGGFSAGFNFIILKDLIETTDVAHRQKLQRLLKEHSWPTMFGETLDSDEFRKLFK